MKELSAFFKKYFINILLSLVVFLMLLSCFLVIVNKQIVEESLETQRLAAEVTYELSSNHISVIKNADVALRGFAVLREERLLFVTPKELNASLDLTFTALDSLLALQGYNDPEGIKPLREYQDYLRMMVGDVAIMVDFLRNRQDSLFLEMFKLDKGKKLGPLINAAEKAIIVDYEDKLNKEAKARTAAAMQNNIYIQIFMVILGIPSVILLFIKLRKDDEDRKKLLVELEENNRKFLFNPGVEYETDNATSIIQNSIYNFEQAADFVTKISKGDFNVDWAGVTDANRDKNTENLAGKLIKLREDLKNIKAEDEKRFWVNEGLTQFSVLVRNNQDSLEKLSLEVVRFLTKYMGAQQGSLFITKEDKDTYLELTACYALDRKKFIEKRIEIGEGLVGQTYLEKETVVLTDVPQGYISITSGLGDATPNCVVVVPFKYNDIVEAIFEIAGFWILEPYKVEFLEKAGEFVASALTSVKTSEKMKILLEESRQQSEEMRATEEELRQNMEEMQSTQEEMQRLHRESNLIN